MILSRRLFLASLAAAAATPAFADDLPAPDLSQEPFPVKNDENKIEYKYRRKQMAYNLSLIHISLSRDVSRRATDRRPVSRDGDLLSADGGRDLALAPGRRRRDLALPCRSAAGTEDRGSGRTHDRTGSRSDGGRATAGRGADRGMAGGAQSGGLDAGRLHRLTGL